MYFYFSRMVSGSPSAEIEQYGGSYFAFLLTGMAFLDYLGVSLQTFNQSLRDSQLMGTLEIMLLSFSEMSCKRLVLQHRENDRLK
jgi:ABC-2 type transport system permease protein